MFPIAYETAAMVCIDMADNHQIRLLDTLLAQKGHQHPLRGTKPIRVSRPKIVDNAVIPGLDHR